jgi:hypothetical protein
LARGEAFVALAPTRLGGSLALPLIAEVVEDEFQGGFAVAEELVEGAVELTVEHVFVADKAVKVFFGEHVGLGRGRGGGEGFAF